MFTGLIEEKASVLALAQQAGSVSVVIESPFHDWQAGESIAVNGVCLTALTNRLPALAFVLSPETQRLTALAALQVGDYVNLERAMQATGRFGGHYVSGHVDTQARIASIQEQGDCIHLVIDGFRSQDGLYLVPKGSITVDGVSLTINALVGQSIELMLIPHTLQQTTLGCLRVGHRVNIEFDYLTRVVAHQMQIREQLCQEVAL